MNEFAKWATLLLCVAFSWRSILSWKSVKADEPKACAASLITLMLIGSLANMARLLAKK